MFGSSYAGATQMLAAIAHPPHLAGICPIVTASDYHENRTYQGGAFEQWFVETWTSLALSRDTLGRAAGKYTNAVNAPGPASLGSLPLLDYPLYRVDDAPLLATGFLAPYFQDWLAHPDNDAYWKAFSVEIGYPQIRVPALHVGAWYDIFLGGTLRNYVGLRTSGAIDAVRGGQRLIVTVGGHSGNGPQIGALDFGPDAAFDEDETTIRWYDYLFRHAANEFSTDRPVRLFVMGTNQWREEDAWPLTRARPTKYFLHSQGRSLNTTRPGEEQPERYVYDPADPAPTIGGPLCVATSAVDTDFTGMLVDVWPDGFAQNLTSGILRLRYRNSTEKPELAGPGQIYHIAVDLAATSNVLRAGHRLRLEVSRSNFPRFDRNINTGELQAIGIRAVTAANTIYHDRAHPSALILQGVPGADSRQPSTSLTRRLHSHSRTQHLHYNRG